MNNGMFALRNIGLALCVSAGLLCTSAGAVDQDDPESPRKLSLEECIEIALRNQPAIGAEQAAVGAAEEQRKMARSYFFPQVDLSTRFTHLDEHRSVDVASPITGAAAQTLADSAAFFGLSRAAGTSAALAALDNPNASIAPGVPAFNALSQAALAAQPNQIRIDLLGETFLTNQIVLTQPLWTGGKIRFRHQQAQLGVSAALEDLRKSRQQTVFNVTRAYYATILARILTQVGEDTHGEFRAIERLIDSLLEAGNEYVTAADSNRAGTLTHLAASEKAKIERSREVAHAALREALGIGPVAELTLASDELPMPDATFTWEELIGLAIAQRPELTKTRLAVEAADLDRRLATADFHPDIALFGSFSTIHDNRSFPNPNDAEEWAIGIGVNMPLFAGGRRFAAARKRSFEQARSRQRDRQVENLVALEVRQAFVEYNEVAERLPESGQARDAAAKSLDLYWDQYKASSVRDADMPDFFVDLESVRILLTKSEVAYYQLLFRYNVALARLRLVLGDDELPAQAARSKTIP